MTRARINVIIDLPRTQRFRLATVDALLHAAMVGGIEAEIREIRTNEIDEAFLTDLGDGVVLGPGTPYDTPRAAEDVIRLARERGVPLVAT